MINPVAFEIFGREVRWYGIIIAIGVLLACLLAAHLSKKKGYNSDMAFDLALLLLPLAVIGARAYYVIFEWEKYAANPISALYVWEGGLAIYGGVIGGAIAVLIFCKWKKLSFFELADIVAPGLILAQSIGRWGNFANQEAFGERVTDVAQQWFPLSVYIQRPNVIDPATGFFYTPGWFQATFFYESIWNLIGFFLLYFFFKKSKYRGNVFALYLIFYGLGRAIIEGMRTDSLWLIPGVIRVSVLLSIVLIFVGLVYMIFISKRLKPFEYNGKYSLKTIEPIDGAEKED